MKKSILFDCLLLANTTLNRHEDQFKHFSFVIQNNRIVASGKNRYTLHSPVRGYPSNAKIHSEVCAIRRAGLNSKKNNVGFSVVNIRINRFGAFRRSKPCSCCEFYLRLFGCREVWYTTYSGFERMRL